MSYFKWKLPLKKYGMVPDHSFFKEMSSCSIGLVPDKFYEQVEEGSIVLKKSERFRFHEDGVIVDDELVPTKSDLVIFATGFRGDKKLEDIFVSEKLRKSLAGPSFTISLYRYSLCLQFLFSCFTDFPGIKFSIKENL